MAKLPLPPPDLASTVGIRPDEYRLLDVDIVTCLDFGPHLHVFTLSRRHRFGSLAFGSDRSCGCMGRLLGAGWDMLFANVNLVPDRYNDVSLFPKNFAFRG